MHLYYLYFLGCRADSGAGGIAEYLPEFCANLGRRECDAVWQIESKDPSVANCHPDVNGGLKTLVPGDDFEPRHLFDSPREIFDLQRRQFVPGAKWTSYSLATSEGIFDSDRQSRRFNYIRVALIADFPLLAERVLYFSEKLHQALVHKCPSANFTGCDRAGNYLRSNHHAYLIPVIKKGRAVAFEICCANGFTLEEQAFLALRKLYFKQSRHISLKIVAMGCLSDYVFPSKVWRSSTPMFLPRYPATLRGKPRMLKKSIYQKDGAEHQALKLLLHLPQFECLKGINIDYQPTGFGLKQWIDGELFCQARATVFARYWQWKCDRERVKKAVNRGYWVQLCFAQSQPTPIAIGSAAHFCLGVFAPVAEIVGSEHDRTFLKSSILDSS